VWAAGGVCGTLHILWGWRSRGYDLRSDVGALKGCSIGRYGQKETVQNVFMTLRLSVPHSDNSGLSVMLKQ